MRKRTKIMPYIFLGVLGVIIVFLAGVRYGQTVKTADNIAAYILSITPSPTIEPTLVPTIGYMETHHTCGVTFMIPTYLEQRDYGERSSVYLNAYDEPVLDITCEQEIDLLALLSGEASVSATPQVNPEGASASASIDVFLNNVAASAVATDEASVEYYTFILERPEPDVTITVQQSLLSLLQKTIVVE